MERAAAAPRLRRMARILVTAGPTREPIDPVRFLSNESSGRMGFAIASAARAAGHEVVLVAGPVQLATPAGVRRVDVTTAREMLAALKEHFPACDALYMAAAVADWRPKRVLAGKWRAKDGGAATARLELVRNPDLLATVARGKARGKRRLVVGFALESGDGEARARAKLRRKNLDFVVLNGPSALNAARTSVIIHGVDGSRVVLENRTKEAVARALVGLLARPVRAASARRRAKAEGAAR